MRMLRTVTMSSLVIVTASSAVLLAYGGQSVASRALPRAADGKVNFQGIWQARTRAAHDLEDHDAGLGLLAGRSVVDGGTIPYQPWARRKKAENFANRKKLDPLENCYLPGVPRIMYMDFPFHILQARDRLVMAFEWSQVYRIVYTNGSTAPMDISFWMGDSRGRWDGDTLVVNVTNHNDRTWFDMAGDFHSDQLQLVEHYTMTEPDTIQYSATFTDPKVFTKPWTIRVPLVRQKDIDRVLEYQCNAEAEEANGDFPREPRTWFSKPMDGK
jgi:hypothetical protein